MSKSLFEVSDMIRTHHKEQCFVTLTGSNKQVQSLNNPPCGQFLSLIDLKISKRYLNFFGKSLVRPIFSIGILLDALSRPPFGSFDLVFNFSPYNETSMGLSARGSPVH